MFSSVFNILHNACLWDGRSLVWSPAGYHLTLFHKQQIFSRLIWNISKQKGGISHYKKIVIIEKSWKHCGKRKKICCWGISKRLYVGKGLFQGKSFNVAMWITTHSVNVNRLMFAFSSRSLLKKILFSGSLASIQTSIFHVQNNSLFTISVFLLCFEIRNKI